MYKLNKKTDWIFIGDGKNDEAIAKIAPKAFGINPHEKLKSVNNLVEISSFMDILPYLQEIAAGSIKLIDQAKAIESKQIKPTDEIGKLNIRVMQLKESNRKLQQKYNNLKGKVEHQSKNIQVPVYETDYEKTSRVALPELLKGIRVTFVGLRKDFSAYKRLKQFCNLNIISIEDQDFDTDIVKQSNFIFIYKNFSSHPLIWRAIENSQCPYCLLKEHTSEQLLSNALANVLHRYIYER